MQISKETLNILKNFSSINPNIQLREGNVLKTISPQKNVMAECTVAETFPTDFGIYDLSEFLGAVSAFDTPEITFDAKVASIGDGSGEKIDYFAADPTVLTLPPEKKISFPTADVEFELTGAALTKITRLASVLKATDLSIVGDGSALTITVCDPKNPASNKYSVPIGDTDLSFRANIKIDNLKMIHMDYVVSVSSKKISRWEAKEGSMTVFVALESTSQF